MPNGLYTTECLQALLALGALLVSLLVDHACEGVLELPGNAVRNGNNASQQQTSRLAVPQRGCEEAERRAVIHGRVGHIEWERGHRRVHQDAKVVAEVCACDAERPHRGQDEGVAGEEERDRGVLDEWVLEERRGGLIGEGFVVAERYVSVLRRVWRLDRLAKADVQVVSEDAEREDGHGERVAPIATVTTEELSDDLVVVLCVISDMCSATLALQQ